MFGKKHSRPKKVISHPHPKKTAEVSNGSTKGNPKPNQTQTETHIPVVCGFWGFDGTKSCLLDMGIPRTSHPINSRSIFY
mmetsp:Transcript_19277/g.23715  ORF Transcript_19277/g.23715 Transcript_19277/m.23715 type:complete len:80 (-) Transcript_19277:177-416(-)